MSRTPNPEPTCRSCGAPNTPGSSECWLCQRRDWNRPGGVRTRMTPPPEPPPAASLSAIGGLTLGMMIIVGVIALLPRAPGIVIVLLISAAPALAITARKARLRSRSGEPMSILERVVRIVVLTILIPILVLLALAIAAFTVCFVLSVR